MSSEKKQKSFLSSLQEDRVFPIVTAIAAGLYPLLFYYTNNYKMINSWEHLGFFVVVFLLAPIIIFFSLYKISNIGFLKKYRPFVLPLLNFFFFFSYLNVALYAGFSWKRSLIVFLIAVLFAFIFKKFFKKIVVIQLILAVIGVITLVPVVINQLNYSKAWMEQPDDIEVAIFKKKPNIYYIQPDGYTNFSELKRGYYNIPNTDFEDYLKENNFISYPDSRSNYAATLPTNSAMFMMKHHYYNDGSDFTETIDAREVIISDNSVLRILKNNGYRTFFVSEQPYFLTNKPKLGYDFCNFSSREINFLTTGIGEPRDVIEPFREYMESYPEGPNFFFVEIFDPGHITSSISDTKGVEGEREQYIENLQKSNEKLTRLIQIILENDSDALIMLMADHGGFVGMTNTAETYAKNLDRDFVNSIFSTILSIHWPNGDVPEFDDKLKTSVNLFRILTTYLSEDESYLENLQPDKSYIIIDSGAPKGVYEYLDDDGKVVFKKH